MAPSTRSGNPSAPSRRLAVSASVAAVCGLGLGWWKFLYAPSQTANGAEGDAKAYGDGPERQFWLTTFDTPTGGRLPLASFRGKLLLVNFWATWCPPCVEELPLINAFFQENKAKSWQVVGIAADNAKAVSDFTAKLPLSFPLALAGMAGVELSRSLGNLAGGLPFTVIFGKDGKVLHRQMGRLTAEHLATWSRL